MLEFYKSIVNIPDPSVEILVVEANPRRVGLIVYWTGNLEQFTWISPEFAPYHGGPRYANPMAANYRDYGPLMQQRLFASALMPSSYEVYEIVHTGR